MSRETVIALRRFTEKMSTERTGVTADLANALRSKNVPLYDALVASTRQSPFDSFEKMLDTEPTRRAVGPEAQLLDAGSFPNKTPAAPAAKPEQSWMDWAKGIGSSAAGAIPASAGLIGAGGLVGGLGAYGLSRLLRSKEDENKFPWLSTLLGTAGGGALAAYLQSQTNSPGTPMANPNYLVDRMVTDPRVMAPGLQQSNPRDFSGSV